MTNISGAAESLSIHFKRAVNGNGLNMDAAAGRTLVQGVLRYWSYGMGPTPIVLKGGGLFEQTVRETMDADISTFRTYSPAEFHKGMSIIAALLDREGISVEHVSEAPKLIDTGYGDPVVRYVVRGKVGGVRANSQIDMSLAQGPHALSRDTALRDIPSLVGKLPSLRIHCQPLHAAAAEKLLAVVMQPDTDFRIKHQADLLNGDLWDGADCTKFAGEVMRTCRHRGIDIESLPMSIGFPAIRRLEGAWDKHRQAGKTSISIAEAYVSLEYMWQTVREDLGLKLAPSLHEAAVSVQRIGGMR